MVAVEAAASGGSEVGQEVGAAATAGHAAAKVVAMAVVVTVEGRVVGMAAVAVGVRWWREGRRRQRRWRWRRRWLRCWRSRWVWWGSGEVGEQYNGTGMLLWIASLAMSMSPLPIMRILTSLSRCPCRRCCRSSPTVAQAAPVPLPIDASLMASTAGVA